MESLATALRKIPSQLSVRFSSARKQTDDLFAIVREEAMYDRPIPERHRIIFYLGHVEAFDWNLLGERAFGLSSFNKTFDHLFAFGIDPVDGGLPADQPADWPTRAEVDNYNSRLRTELDSAIRQALDHPAEGHPDLLEMIETAIEHRLMHAETLAYMLHRLPTERKVAGPAETQWKTGHVKSHLVEIPEGRTTLGLSTPGDDAGRPFGWDN